MKNSDYKNKYKRLKKVIWAGASSGVVTGMIVMGVASPAIAETVEGVVSVNGKASPMHTMRRWDSPSRAGSIAGSLGLDKAKVLNELKSGKNMKQILQENGINTENLQNTFGNRKSHSKRMWKQGLNKISN